MSGMTVVYVFQAIGAVATSLSVAVALWVILWRDPHRERQRLIERDEERADAREAQLRTWREEAGAVQPQAIRISPDLTGGIHQWHCGYTNRSRTVIADATAIVTAIDQENPERDVNYSVLDLKAHTELAESIGRGGRRRTRLLLVPGRRRTASHRLPARQERPSPAVPQGPRRAARHGRERPPEQL